VLYVFHLTSKGQARGPPGWDRDPGDPQVCIDTGVAFPTNPGPDPAGCPNLNNTPATR